MIPVLFHIGPLAVYSYGMMMAIGFLAADYVITLECRRQGITVEYASSIVVWGALVGISCSRLLDIFNNFSTYWADPKSMIFSGSGFVWYGGMFGGIFGTYLVSRYYKIGFLKTIDMCAPALAIGQALGRIGCQLSGDGDWGLPSTLPWAMAYPRAIVGWNSETVLKLDSHGQLVSGFFPGVRVHPAPIYETILYTGVFLVLWRFRGRGWVHGRLFYLYLILAGAARFIVEFVRINPRVFAGLSEAQLFGIGMVIFGSVAWYLSRDKRESDKRESGDKREAVPAKEALRA
ncbi:MAG: prolipoprotein diacylglyceryl transferase [Candidatus Binataceae bacterium]